MSIFNIDSISPILEKNNIDSSSNNCYIFLMFFLQRCQLISNIIKIFNPREKKTFTYGIKYVILNDIDYEFIKKRIKDFRREFEKGDLINEILNFIKSSMDNQVLSKKINDITENDKTDDLIRPIYFKTKLDSLINDFESIDKTLKIISDSVILTEDEISNYINEEKKDRSYVSEENKRKIDRELTRLDLRWLKYKKQKNKKNLEMYDLLRHWFEI